MVEPLSLEVLKDLARQGHAWRWFCLEGTPRDASNWHFCDTMKSDTHFSAGLHNLVLLEIPTLTGF